MLSVKAVILSLFCEESYCEKQDPSLLRMTHFVILSVKAIILSLFCEESNCDKQDPSFLRVTHFVILSLFCEES